MRAPVFELDHQTPKIFRVLSFAFDELELCVTADEARGFDFFERGSKPVQASAFDAKAVAREDDVARAFADREREMLTTVCEERDAAEDREDVRHDQMRIDRRGVVPRREQRGQHDRHDEKKSWNERRRRARETRE